MMSVIDEYLATLSEPECTIIEHMYTVVRQFVPSGTEELSYNMPTLKHNGKAVLSIMSNAKFMSLYPHSAIENLGLNLKGYDCTTGSIHFTQENPINDDLLEQIVTARLEQIDTRVK